MGNAFAFAARLLSLLPPLTPDPPTRAEARLSVALFPMVGALIGLLTACAWNLASHLWAGTPLVAAAVALAVGAALSAGRPLADLARAGDGLAAYGSGGGDRSRVFAVMRDPRRGAGGLVALAVSVALQLALLSALPPASSWGILILAGALGRWAAAFGLTAFPAASTSTRDGESAYGLSDAGPQEFLVATVLTIVCAAVLPVRGILALVAVGLIVGPVASSVSARLGGLSLPLSQALGVVGETVALACLTVHAS